MPTVRNTLDHAVDLHDGRTLAPGKSGETTAERAAELGLPIDAPEPPARNATTEEWREHATAVDVAVPEGASRADIIAALTEAGYVNKEG